ncbi:hypothetical protein EMN47_20210 [Prolixibacteraceae bacterium JC049]|nr:hypothetical protein [Prolixibacteraceae bacterium JC049]
MNRMLILVLLMIFMSCFNKTTEKESDNQYENNYTLDTVLSDYLVDVVLPSQYLEKGCENEMILGIKGVPDENVIIYTKTSQATIRLNNDTTGYLIFPKISTDSVGIYVNINKDGEMTLIGKLIIETK